MFATYVIWPNGRTMTAASGQRVVCDQAAQHWRAAGRQVIVVDHDRNEIIGEDGFLAGSLVFCGPLNFNRNISDNCLLLAAPK